MFINSAIILPLKESFSDKDFGAVSIWVDYYLKYTKKNNDYVFCRKLPDNYKYLNNKLIPVDVRSKFYTNLQYIKKISAEITKRNISIVEIHNRPEYAYYLIKNNPHLKINLIFHNDPNTIRYSNKSDYKKFLLDNCNKIVFVSNWVKKRFFLNLNFEHKNNVKVIYNFINPIKKFPKKEKIIVFSGKLNTSKGFEVFGSAIIEILNKYTDWQGLVYGNEQRERFNFIHPRLKINNWISHKNLLKIYEKSSISVVNPTWEEPFGRTALESASRGCAVITSKSGGLSETFNNNFVLKNNNKKELVNAISKLIEDKSLINKIQKQNFKNVIHSPEKSVSALDKLRIEKKITIPSINKYLKILHISNFGIKNDHRLFNLSIAKKISNGFIRNGHDVINFDYRNHNEGLILNNSLDKKIISITKNYRPDLILFGHNNSLSRNSIISLKEKFRIKIALWYEDHVMKGDPSYRKNLDLIEKNNDLIDNYFITTSPDIIKTKISKNKINFLPIPVDPNIENGKFYEIKKDKDLFFALSHGVNFGKLKKNTFDERSKFVDKLIEHSNNRINFNILGLYNEEPKWNYDFTKELMICKTALNLSRGGPNKYASSNRIASLMGNGVLPFIHTKVKYQDFFDDDEIVIYNDHKDLINKLIQIIEKPRELKKRSIKSKKSYFNYFQNNIIADFMLNRIFGMKKKYKYVWSK
tara:strand:- start:3907 stop:6000 length:2094 start_codon:yes stop_codon:yes gene_type:complete